MLRIVHKKTVESNKSIGKDATGNSQRIIDWTRNLLTDIDELIEKHNDRPCESKPE